MSLLAFKFLAAELISLLVLIADMILGILVEHWCAREG
jgi:hypothetical protein